MSVLFSCIHGKWTWVRQSQIFREPLRGSRDLSRTSPKFISYERRKKDTHSLNKQTAGRPHVLNGTYSQAQRLTLLILIVSRATICHILCLFPHPVWFWVVFAYFAFFLNHISIFDYTLFAKDDWRGFNTRNAYMVHTVNSFWFSNGVSNKVEASIRIWDDS